MLRPCLSIWPSAGIPANRFCPDPNGVAPRREFPAEKSIAGAVHSYATWGEGSWIICILEGLKGETRRWKKMVNRGECWQQKSSGEHERLRLKTVQTVEHRRAKRLIEFRHERQG